MYGILRPLSRKTCIFSSISFVRYVKIDYNDVKRRKRRLKKSREIRDDMGMNAPAKHFKQIFDTDNKPIPISMKLIRAKQAVKLPDIKGISLAKTKEENITSLCQTKFSTTLLLISWNQYSQDLLSQWVKPFLDEYETENNDVQVLELSIASKWYIKYISGLLRNKLKKTIEPSRHQYFYNIYENFNNKDREIMGLDNPLAGYIFLIDHQGKIRGKASGGISSPEEFTQLVRLTDELIQEQKQ